MNKILIGALLSASSQGINLNPIFNFRETPNQRELEENPLFRELIFGYQHRKLPKIKWNWLQGKDEWGLVGRKASPLPFSILYPE